MLLYFVFCIRVKSIIERKSFFPYFWGKVTVFLCGKSGGWWSFEQKLKLTERHNKWMSQIQNRCQDSFIYLFIYKKNTKTTLHSVESGPLRCCSHRFTLEQLPGITVRTSGSSQARGRPDLGSCRSVWINEAQITTRLRRWVETRSS